jgi:hypothetical protein
MLRCESSWDIYPLQFQPHQALTASSSSAVSLWHQCLGHPGNNVLSQVLASFDFTYNKTVTHTCSSRRMGQHIRLPFSDSTTKTYLPFQLLDVWTCPMLSHSGYKYYVLVLDDYTQYLWTSLSGRNLRCYRLYVPSRHMSRLCSGYPFSLSKQTMAKEFDSTALHLFLTEHGIQFHLSCPYTSQQNKKTEHVLRTLNDCVRTMLVHSAALLAFWAEALSMETHLVNRRPCCANLRKATSARVPLLPQPHRHHVPQARHPLHVVSSSATPRITAATAATTP